MLPETMRWNEKEYALELLDQRALPGEVKFVVCKTSEEVACAIENMTVRGAPAIGACAAYGLAIAAREGRRAFDKAFLRLAQTRPTAVHLFWSLERMQRAAFQFSGKEFFKAALNEANAIFSEDIEINKSLSRFGAELLPQNATVLTHCNAGSIATCGVGTALGVLREARAQGKNIKVYADETRPRLQGAKLTAWELEQDGFDVTLITDSMAAFLMSQKKIDAVIVGADRVANNGDTANKIGTYALAIAAKYHGVPFYAAVPFSTIDVSCNTGADIPVEMRSQDEVRRVGSELITTSDMKTWNPAFDITPSVLISGIITEHGVAKAPYNLRKFMEENR